MTFKIARESTGIRKVDNMIKGGLPQNSIIGISGPPGIGKSIFTLHYLLEGARQGKKCLYLNLEEPMQNIDNMISSFSFADELYDFINKKMIIIKCYNYNEFEKIYSAFFNKITEDKNIKRLVIDSFNGFYNYVMPSSEKNTRGMINDAFRTLRSRNITTLITLEKEKNSEHDIFHNVSYLIDGMINLDFLELGTIERRIFIPKMRWTKQFKESMAYDIGSKGIRIVKEED